MIKKFFYSIYSRYLEIKIYPKYGYIYISYLKLIGYRDFILEFFFPLKKSSIPLDVIITVAKKDINKLENTLVGIRKNILHTISNIFIVFIHTDYLQFHIIYIQVQIIQTGKIEILREQLYIYYGNCLLVKN